MRITPSNTRAALVCAILLIASSTARADPPGVREADVAIARADREAVRLLQILDETRRARNLGQIACVDQQLSQVNSFNRMLQLRRDRLRAAISRGNHAEITHERSVIRRASAQLTRIARAGLACVYPPAGHANRTIVEVTVSPDIRHRDLSPPPPSRE